MNCNRTWFNLVPKSRAGRGDFRGIAPISTTDSIRNEPHPNEADTGTITPCNMSATGYSLKRYRIVTTLLPNSRSQQHHSDPERVKFLESIHNTDVLVLDDFLTTPINEATAHQLLTIIAERENRGATIVTSQFAPIEWCKSIPDAVIAESILNRLAVGAEIITLEGDNMRLTH